ncbi:amiloride-sensitive sodium channel pickpocket 23 isoform X2 [Rhodnius prolixus]
MHRALRKPSVSTYKLLKTSLKYQTKEYFNNSTLHGVRFIAEEDRPTFERLMWFSFVSIGAIVTLIIITSLWEKFQTNPTITGLDTDFHNWDVPFPGVTVCPKNRASDKLIKAYIEKRWTTSDLSEEKKKFYYDYINLISNLTYSNLKEIDKFKNDKTLPQENLRSVLLAVVMRCGDLINNCEWKGRKYDCCSGFLPTFTEHGFCYSFNTVRAETDWPWKAKNSSVINLTTHYIYETDTRWSVLFNGNAKKNPYSIYIHSSDALPSIEMHPQHVWTKTISKIQFASKTTYTTEESKQLSAKQRKCVFPYEVKLATAPEYSYWACMSECRMKFALKKCSCVPYFYHKIDGFPYCNLDGLVCLSKYTDDFKKSLYCPCELGCMNTVYEVEKLVDSNEKAKNPVEIGFVSWPMVRYKREVLFGWVDLLVAFGGIAGLFLGFSLLSAVEIVYYFTMRAMCMMYKDKNRVQQLAEEEENRKVPKVDLSLRPSYQFSKKFNQINQHSVNNNLQSSSTKQNIMTLPFLN